MRLHRPGLPVGYTSVSKKTCTVYPPRVIGKL